MDDGRSEKLSTFLAVADCEPEVAQQYLESCAWDIDAAINTFLATGGAGGAAPRGDAAMAGDGALADALYEDEVRAPIAQMRGRLVEAPLYHMADGGRAGARGGAGVARAGVFEHVTHAKEAFRDFEQEASSLGAHGAGTGGAPRGTADDDDGEGDEQFRSLGSGAAAAATKKPKNLAAIYRPPLELCFRGSFDELRAAGREAGKWLLVNIQSPIEFASQQLNADTWRDEPLRCAARPRRVRADASGCAFDAHARARVLRARGHAGAPHLTPFPPSFLSRRVCLSTGCAARCSARISSSGSNTSTRSMARSMCATTCATSPCRCRTSAFSTRALASCTRNAVRPTFAAPCTCYGVAAPGADPLLLLCGAGLCAGARR